MQAASKPTVIARSPASHTRRKRRSKSELHASITRVATELFAAKGFAEPTIREIAEGADVALPTLYRLFEDKKDIYIRCCKLAAQRHTQRLLADQDSSESGEVSLFRMMRREMLSCQERTVENHLVHRIYIDGDQDVIKDEMDQLIQSKICSKIRDVFEIGSQGNLSKLRQVMLDRFFHQLPAVFSIWPDLFNEDNPDQFVKDVLTVLLPAIDWTEVARQV